jgi:hypothetical protein
LWRLEAGNTILAHAEYVFRRWSVKTSLNLDDSVYEDARKASKKSGRSLSETISEWARLGRNLERARTRDRNPRLFPVDLGEPLIDFDQRSAVTDALDDDRP